MNFYIRIVLLLAFGTCLFAQPAERPPRPGEPIRPPTGDKPPAVDRPRRRKIEKLEFAFAVAGGAIAYPKGSWINISLGATYGKWGFGAELGYTDYERDFIGSYGSYVSPGNKELGERGSFVRPSVYGEYIVDAGPVRIAPRATLGYANIICRRWVSSSITDSSRYERARLVNTWELNIGVRAGALLIGGTVQWWAVNPWFYVYPDDYGLLTMGCFVGLR
ncbi:hypothetical protein DRQ36_07385 [bacterium]|nr:MAG: hypothetical protein DRQ36_07385 [bacterium]